LARKARRLTERLTAATAERQESWAKGHTEIAAMRTDDLADLHQDKRSMRREIYDVRPDLEGRPVFKGVPGGRA